MIIKWNEEKNNLLKEIRDVSFEQVVEEIANYRNTEPEINPAHPHQFITFVKINDYPYAVPFVVDDEGNWFLKTIYPSRKAKRRFEHES